MIAKAVNGCSRLPLGGTASVWRRNQTSQVPSAKQQQEAGEGDQRGSRVPRAYSVTPFRAPVHSPAPSPARE